MASSNTMFKSHEDYRRNKELEEARKAGIAPAAVDEEGKEINPHIPQYMSSAPWYLNQPHPTLKHQKNWREQLKEKGRFQSSDRGVKTFQATTYRKGACENCGAMTHKTKDCVERPRKIGAKFTKAEIAADEKLQTSNLEGFDAKKDRWNGYDTAEYARVMDLYEKSEKAKQEAKKKKALERVERGEKLESDDDADDDKIDETEEAGFDKLEKRVRTTGGGASGTVRNLRIREDTAKYLYNLDANSAHYDPKSRSMRADPQPDKPANEKSFMGDNWTRQTGDFYGLQALTVHAMQAQQSGSEIHPQAAPSQAEALHKQFKAKKESLDKASKGSIMDRYGNAARAPDSDEQRLLLGQTEGYVEYNAAGRVIKGEEVKARSRYEEDVHPGNHSSVWGSWWKDGEWGYACCHQAVKNSYCTGTAGETAAQDSLALQEENLRARAAMPPPATTAKPQAKSAWGTEVEGDVEIDQERLKAALKRHREQQSGEPETDDRKRKYNSLANSESGISNEDMEAYRLTRARRDDPLAQKDSANGYDYV